MSSPSANKSAEIRAAAILTTAEVNGAIEPLFNRAWSHELSVSMNFTIGSLTNVTIRYYASMDQVTYFQVETLGGVVSHVLTADTKKIVQIRAPGWTWLRVSAQGSGTVTGSTLTLRARWMTRSP